MQLADENSMGNVRQKVLFFEVYLLDIMSKIRGNLLLFLCSCAAAEATLPSLFVILKTLTNLFTLLARL